jgi:hypothetical protein
VAVTVTAALVAAEGLTALGFGLFAGYETVTGEALDPATAIGVTVLALAGGVGMLGCARGLLRGASWSRAPAALIQFFALPVAWSLWQGGRYLIAVPLGVVAVLALVTLFTPASTGWLVTWDEQDEDEPQPEAQTRRPRP